MQHPLDSLFESFATDLARTIKEKQHASKDQTKEQTTEDTTVRGVDTYERRCFTIPPTEVRSR